jgi:ribosomal protein S18 acetylase RimI-like enzyme
VGSEVGLAAARIRRYDATRDLAEFRALNVEHQDFSRSLEPSWPEGVKVVDDYVAYLLKDCEARNGGVLMAEADGGIAGFICVVTTMGPGSPDDPATFAWVHDIYVRPAFRRQGVARALMAAGEAFVRARGARELRLGVIDRNVNARAMYRELGFRDYLRVLTKPLDARVR